MTHRETGGRLANQLKQEVRRVVHGTMQMPKTSTVMATYPRTSRFINRQSMFPRKRGAFPVKGLRYPSVSTILSCTMPPESRERLENWAKKRIEEVGKKEFQADMSIMATTSNHLHKALATYLLHGRRKPKNLPPEITGYWDSLRMILPMIEPSKAYAEGTLTHPILCYRGRFDAILRYRSSYVLVDWKCASPESSRSNAALDRLRVLKLDREQLHDDPLQMAAYLGALNYERKVIPGQDMKHSLLVLAQENGDLAHVIELDEKIMQEAWKAWIDRVRKFWLTLNSTPLDQGCSFIPDYETTTLSNRSFEKVRRTSKSKSE